MSGYIGTQPVPQATQTRDSFTATSGQTTFATGGYTPNFLDVYLNGVKLASADYTAANGSDVVLASGAATGDILEVVAFTTFNSASSSIDDNGNATAITIDSSENVLIGTADATPYDNTSGNGILLGDGLISSAQSGGNAAIFNRMTSDGSIVNFRKDGSTIGSIGVWNNDNISLYGNSTHAGIGCATNSVEPIRNNAPTDNSIDLGVSSARFKDAYLSGGVYLGGTGSANKLDDYESGTWTPVDGSGQVTILGATGVYTRVGRQVTVIGAFTYPSTSQTNYAIIAGLPFSVSNYSDAVYASGSVQTSYIPSTNKHLAPLAYKNNTHFYFYGAESALTNADFSTRNFRINITYFTDQ